MVLGAVEPHSAELDSYIDAYEAVRGREGQVDLAGFLPPRDDPLYLPVLRELARVDLEYGWRHGQPRPLREYQDRFPELFQDRDGLQEITFEEYRLRLQLGDSPSPAEYQQRWGVNTANWPGSRPKDENVLPVGAGQQSAASVKALGPSPNPLPAGLPEEVTFPEVSTNFLDFHLLVELGRGAFGRVYLVQQKGLAGRHVVLKIATNISLETRMLAQLQHTNIIPVYSVHHAGALHALCMPYLGSTTLADVLKELCGRQSLPQSGKGLVDTAQACKSITRQEIASRGLRIENRQGESLDKVPEVAPVAWKQLERLTYVQAVVWLASRLADGLAHAHERGILHRDLKPANVLLTDDGQPMLLDFNLSEDTKPDCSAAVFIGGTLPYMAPEHLEAFQRSPARVDVRSDVYSLGVILCELLTGRQPFPTRTGPIESVLTQMIQDRHASPPRLRRWNRAISPAVESMVRHCLEPEPTQRYQSARELQEDLQRQMEDRPLRFAPEPSLRERTGKWVRRHPRLTPIGVGLLALFLIAGLTGLLILRNLQQARWEAIASYQHFRGEVQKARLLLATSRPTDRERLGEGFALAHKALDRYQIRSNPAWWELPEVWRLSPEDQEHLREEAAELLLLLASVNALQARTEGPAHRAEGFRSALDLNRLAEVCYPEGKVPALLWRQRASLGRLLDPTAKPKELPSAATKDPPSTRDLCLSAQDLMDQDRFPKALPLWQQATRQGPRDLWTWAGLAVCYENLAKYPDAAACYGTCIALAPQLPWLYFKRGVASLNARKFADARADFDRFLTDRPEVPEGYINRALSWEGLKKDLLALQDIDKAIELRTSQTRVYFIRSLLRARVGDRDGAKQDHEKGVQLKPADELSWVVRGEARLGTDPKAALADFERALQLNPRLLNALQNKASVLSEQLGQTLEAVKVLNKLIDLYPHYVPARAGRGVLLARLGKRTEALQDAEESLRRDLQPATRYQVAGIYALTSKQQPGDQQEAFFLLSSALKQGYGWNLLAIDTDLDPIRNHPEFRRLTAKSKGAQEGQK
jgi:serine/threonine protein kinase/tetratricopeptide (TPR) repeat protein